MERVWGYELFSRDREECVYQGVRNATLPVDDVGAGRGSAVWRDDDRFHGAEPPAVAEAYDFSGFGTVVDVGVSTGNMLVHILGRYAGPRGVLFDLPVTLAEAPAFLRKHGMEDRIAIEPGSFFESVPAWADCYILSHVIHDWSEEQNLIILGHCRKVMKPESKLLIVEFVLPSGDSPHPGKNLDMVMLTVAGGEERTEEEYGPLLAKAGLHMTRVVPTTSAASIVEAVVADGREWSARTGSGSGVVQVFR